MPRQPWTDGLLAGFDVETTGVDPFEARIVSATVILAGAELQVIRRSWLVDPGIEIPAEAAAIHGITTERVRAEGQPAAEAIPRIAAAVSELVATGIPVAVFNAKYDLTVLYAELRRQQRALRWAPTIVDPFVIDRHLDPYRRGSRKLVDSCAVYGVTLDQAHDAAADAIAAVRLAWKLAHLHDEIGGRSLQDLQLDQARWHAQWADSFEEYKRQRGEAVKVERGWPFLPEPNGAAA